MQANYNKIKAAGAELIAISSDNLDATKATVNKAGLEFPVLSDSTKETIGDYNVTDPFNKHIARPSSFVITQDGKVAWTVVNEVGHRVPTADIIAELGKL